MRNAPARLVGWVCVAAALSAAGCAGGPAIDPSCDTPPPPARTALPAAAAEPGAAEGRESDDDYQARQEALAERCSLHLDQDITVLDEARIRRAALDTLADIGRTTDEEDIPNRAEDLRFRLLDEYREDGYHFADVDVKIGPPRAKGSRRIDIAAVERERVMVDAIEITGARAIDADELRDYYNDHAKTPVKLFGRPVYNARVAEEAARRMQERYEFEGYPDASARVVETRFNRRRNAVVLRYAVGEGPRAWLRTVRWRALRSARDAASKGGAAAPPTLRLRPWEIRDQLRAAGVREGVPYSPALAGAARSALAAYYSEEGFPFALVQAVETERRRDRNGDWQVTLELLILENDIAGICRIGIHGNHWTAEHVIRREVAHLQGTTYTGTSVRAMQEALTGLGLFKTVQMRRAAHKVWHEELPSEPGRRSRIVVDEEIPDLVDLEIEVTERDWVTARIDLGGGVPEGIRAAPTIDFPNFTAAGHSAQIRAVLSTLRQRIEGKITAPWTLGVPVRTRVDLSWEDRPEPLQKDYSFRAEEARAAVTFSRSLLGDLRGFIGYETASTRVFDAEQEVLQQSSIGTGADATVPDLKLSALNVGWELDGRDNRFSPRTGAYATMRYTFAHEDLGGNVSFHRLEGTIALYYSAGPFTLALRSDSAAVDYDSSDEFPKLPPPFRSFIGGARSVRSFSEGELGPLTSNSGSPLGGLGYGVANVELRTVLWQYADTPFGISLLLFADAGSVWPYADDGRAMAPPGEDRDRYRTRATDVAFALGWGLRFDTFIGPIGFQMGWNPDRHRIPPAHSDGSPRHEDAFAFFFQVGNTF